MTDGSYSEKVDEFVREHLVRREPDGVFVSPAAIGIMKGQGRLLHPDEPDPAKPARTERKRGKPTPKEITPEGEHIKKRKGRSIE